MPDLNQVYLRIEAAEIERTVFDTDDLSTIRGSSLILLHAVRAVDAELPKLAGVTAAHSISLGASIGLWRLETTLQPAEIEKTVGDWLRRAPPGGAGSALGLARHAVFAVAALGDLGCGLAQMKARLAALCNARIAEGLPPPAPGEPHPVPAQRGKGDKPVVCEIDGFRPAQEEPVRVKGDDLYLSESVQDRREYGRDQKQDFYRQELARTGEDAKLPDGFPVAENRFALHFASIPAPKPVSDKIAVLYADGNSFGAIQDHALTQGGPGLPADEAGRQKTFDEAVQAFRNRYLRVLLERVHACAYGPPDKDETEEREALSRRKGAPAFPADRVLRIETLLWGGDEMMFVLPATLGWWAAETLFEMAETGGPDGGPVRIGDDPLTFKTGLVFCHHDAPIDRIRTLTNELADEASKGAGDRETGLRNVCMPMVLESFDMIGVSLDRYAELRLPMLESAGETNRMPLSGMALVGAAGMRQISGKLADILDLGPDFPRKRLRAVAAANYLGLGERLYRRKPGKPEERLTELEAARRDDVWSKVFADRSDDARELVMMLEDFYDYARVSTASGRGAA